VTATEERDESAAMPSDAAADASLAKLHLRLGMLPIALAELEELQARGALDVDGLSDLAEARWRSGDVTRAAAAAVAHLEAGGDEPIALVIAAESAAANGRPSEARANIERLGQIDATALDALFAGMPRRAFWPSAPGSGVEAVTLFETAQGTAAAAAPVGTSGEARRSRPAVGDEEPGLWDAEEVAALTRGSVHPDPAAVLDAARPLLAVDRYGATLRLALVLRLDPTLAPEVLAAIPDRPGPGLEIVRGDAQRLLGRHLEAEAAYAAAFAALKDRPREES
jgi:tetratricopeptide (TPR) repeat protein